MVLPSLGILDLDLLHPFLHGGKRGSLVAFPSDFSSSVLHRFGFWLVTVCSWKSHKKGISVLLQLRATTAELPLDVDVLLDKVIALLETFVFTEVLFEPVTVYVWKSRSSISGIRLRMFSIYFKIVSHWWLLMLSSNMGRVWYRSGTLVQVEKDLYHPNLEVRMLGSKIKQDMKTIILK